jgi:hypothetical protein
MYTFMYVQLPIDMFSFSRALFSEWSACKAYLPHNGALILGEPQSKSKVEDESAVLTIRVLS